MRLSRAALAVPVALAGVLFAAIPAAAQEQPGVRVDVRPTEAAVDLGETLDLTVTVRNETGRAVSDLTAHVDVTQLGRAGSVDPEDWTATLSRPVGDLADGESAEIAWTVQPISPGEFSLYAVALSPDRSEVTASQTLTVSVTDRRSLNPQGVLPAVIGVPVLLGLLLADRMRRDRRRR